MTVIKLKHIKLGKPDTQEHYPSKAEGTSAAAQQGTSERAATPEAKARRPPTETTGTYKSKCTMEKRCAPPDTKTRKTTWEKLGTYPPTNAVTQNLWGLKVRKMPH